MNDSTNSLPLKNSFDSQDFSRYPSKPFINDSISLTDKDNAVNSFPETNKNAVMNALKTLQDKIRLLELERTNAENNFKNLADETSNYHISLCKNPLLPSNCESSLIDRRQADLNGGSSDPIMKVDVKKLSCSDKPRRDFNSELADQLAATTTRSELLEKQLDYMRRMLRLAEQDRVDAQLRCDRFHKQNGYLGSNESDTCDLQLQSKLNRVSKLEQEHLKMNALQSLATNKIEELENKLEEERKQREAIQKKTNKLETAAETNRILTEANDADRRHVKRARKKKVENTCSFTNSEYPKTKKHSKMRGKEKSKPSGSSTLTDHYHLNLAEIPFVAGQSVSPSHSVPANVQRVFSLMKFHNTLLCNGSNSHWKSERYLASTKNRKSHKTESMRPHSVNSNKQRVDRTDSASSHVSSLEDEENFEGLSDLLSTLQQEFVLMSVEHRDLARQIQEMEDSPYRDNLEQDLDELVDRMEAKGRQIDRLRRHKHIYKKKGSKKKSTERPKSSMADSSSIKVKRSILKKETKSTSAVDPHASLKLLKDLKKIQSTLQKDDLSWDS